MEEARHCEPWIRHGYAGGGRLSFGALDRAVQFGAGDEADRPLNGGRFFEKVLPKRLSLGRPE